MSRMIDADAVARALVEHGHVKQTDMAGCRIGDFTSIYGVPVVNHTMPWDDDFGLICLCAVRYAIGRQTYMVNAVVSFVKRNIEYVDERSIRVMIKDIDDARSYGSKFDKLEWMDFRKFLNDRLDAMHGRNESHERV